MSPGDFPIYYPTPAWQKLSLFLETTLPKLVRSYGELVAISEEVKFPGDVLCLMQNALLLVRLIVHVPLQSESDLLVDEDHHHIRFKVFLHHITGVKFSDKKHLIIYTEHKSFTMEILTDNDFYRKWRPPLVFVTAQRLAFEIRLRSGTHWTEIDAQEADFFAGDLPVTTRAGDGVEANLQAIYGTILRFGDVKQATTKKNILRTRNQMEDRFLVLRKCAFLSYETREPLKHDRSKRDQYLSLRAITDVVASSEDSFRIHTATKSFHFFCLSPADVETWISSIQDAVDTHNSSPKRGRITALEQVNHLTTQITIPPKPYYVSGGFANVYKGEWEIAGESMNRKTWGKHTVAVKVFLDRKSEGSKFEMKLRREVAVWHRLDHPNIVPLLGITYDFGSHISMVSPWLENGTLNDYLRSREPQPENLGRLLIDIVDGLAYLHSHDVIHGDLHPANVLIGDNGRAQVTDFGLSLIIPEFEGTSFMTTSVIRGALRWVAPEIFSIRPSGDTSLSVSEMSDVYSFGGIVYQVLCGEMPFADVRNDMQVIVSVKDGQRPKRHRAISTTNWVFLQWCWNSRPEDRPSLVQIREFLQTKLDEPLKGQLHPM